MSNKLLLGALAAALLCGATPAWSGSAAEEVAVHDAYARAVPPVVPNSAAFMTLHNAGTADHTLVSASSPAAATVELHTHINDNGVMRMRPVEGGIAVPAGGSTELQPGGLHVMLIGLHQPLVEGDQVELELTFEDGSTQLLTAPVRKVMAGGMDHQHHHQH
ncbi:MAG: hypothetical protein RLZ44_1303 [Pseudomonadota bacterium]|jgi:copper(I)-binding protein